VKAFHVTLSGLVAWLAILGCARLAQAQSTSPVTRADLSGTIAWLTVQKQFATPFDGDDWHNSFYSGLGAGWYWTDHFKTELDFGVGTESQSYSSRPITIQGRPSFVTTRSDSERRTLGLSQQYQFFRNTWFHPHIAVGAKITWDTVTDEIYPATIYEPPGPPRIVETARIEGPRTDVTVSPFVSTGFKAYMTRRSFFRSDLRVAFRGGVDDVLVRVGFGVDF
jgi:hypothetical protein